MTFLYDVNVLLVGPVRGKPGDCIGVRPGHRDRPVVLLRLLNGVWTPIEVGPPNYGMILGLAESGALTQTYPLYLSLGDVPAALMA